MTADRSPTFSILVPSYNPGAYLHAALDSALEAIGPSDEIVIQDACSTDGTNEVLAEFAQRDPRVKPLVEPDAGQSDALNRALARAIGDWVIWLNADDVIVAGAVKQIREAILNAPQDLDIVTGNHQVLRAGGEVIDDYHGKPITTRTLLRRSTCASFSGSVAIKTEFLRAIGGYETDLNCTMDYALQFNIAERDPRQLAIPVCVGALRIHDASKTSNLWKTFLVESFRLRMAYSRSVLEYLLGIIGTLEQALSFAVFKIRLTRAYRRLRGVFA